MEDDDELFSEGSAGGIDEEEPEQQQSESDGGRAPIDNGDVSSVRSSAAARGEQILSDGAQMDAVAAVEESTKTSPNQKSSRGQAFCVEDLFLDGDEQRDPAYKWVTLVLPSSVVVPAVGAATIATAPTATAPAAAAATPTAASGTVPDAVQLLFDESGDANARLVQWKDGSWSFHVGSAFYQCSVVPDESVILHKNVADESYAGILRSTQKLTLRRLGGGAAPAARVSR